MAVTVRASPLAWVIIGEDECTNGSVTLSLTLSASSTRAAFVAVCSFVFQTSSRMRLILKSRTSSRFGCLVQSASKCFSLSAFADSVLYGCQHQGEERYGRKNIGDTLTDAHLGCKVNLP